MIQFSSKCPQPFVEKFGTGQGNRTLIISLEVPCASSVFSPQSDKCPPSGSLSVSGYLALSERPQAPSSPKNETGLVTVASGTGPHLCLIGGVGAGFYWQAAHAPFGAIPAGFLATVSPLPAAAALAYSRSNSASVWIQHFAAVASPSDSMLIVLVHSTSHRWPRSECAVIRKSSPTT